MVEWITLPGGYSYDRIVDLMNLRVQGVINATMTETVFLLEHEDVYTAGSGFVQNELLNPNEIPVIYTNRGGKWTYHGKGQRIIYPILNLSLKPREKDLKLYVRKLESWVIGTLLRLGVKSFTIENKVGVWVVHKERYAKIAAIGIRIKKWVTYHGVAVNINTDLSKYDGIVPCGIIEYPVTSLQALGVEISIEQFDEILREEFYKIF